MMAVPAEFKPEPDNAPPDIPPDAPPDVPEDRPNLAIRRHTDRCFFEAEEVIHGPGGGVEGYVVEGVMIDVDDVADVRPVSDAACLDDRDP
mgnify:CR=1 FL=1